MDYIIYEDTHYWNSRPIKILTVLSLAVVVAGIIYRVLIIGAKSIQDFADILILLVGCMLISIFFWFRLPRKYLIFADRLKIAKGGPFSTTIPFDNIEEAREATREDLRYTRSSSSKNAVLIIRILESATIIYPRDREEFLKHLNKALSEWKSKTKVDDETNRM